MYKIGDSIKFNHVKKQTNIKLKFFQLFTLSSLICLMLLSCEESLDIDTNKNTFYDDISDITYLNGYFYTTNYDLSGNSGSQIDLLKFLVTVDSKIILEDIYDLGLNGQGYFAITNDGENLFLQSRSTGGVLKLSLVGEWGFFEMDSIASNWQSSGIAYNSDKDSLVLFYRNLDDLSQYRARTVSKQTILNSGSDVTFTIEGVDLTYHGSYAATYTDSNYLFLGVNQSEEDVLFLANSEFEITQVSFIGDSTVVGLCIKNSELYFSYRNRRIESSGIYID